MLKSKKIALRPLQKSDFYLLKRIENNTGNWQFGSERKEYSDKELSDYITNAKTNIKVAKQFRFVIDLNSKPIGFIDLFNYTAKSAGVGLIIAENYRNKGYAKQALRCLSNYAFTTFNLFKLKCVIAKDNLVSIKLFSSCGFALEKEGKELLYFVKLAKKNYEKNR